MDTIDTPDALQPAPDDDVPAYSRKPGASSRATVRVLSTALSSLPNELLIEIVENATLPGGEMAGQRQRHVINQTAARNLEQLRRIIVLFRDMSERVLERHPEIGRAATAQAIAHVASQGHPDEVARARIMEVIETSPDVGVQLHKVARSRRRLVLDALSDTEHLRSLDLQAPEDSAPLHDILSTLELIGRANPGLQDLRLGLSDCGMDDDDMLELAALQNVTALDLGGNFIGPLGAAALARLQGLRSLGLSRNYALGAEGARALSQLVNLTSLNLRETHIGLEGLAALAPLAGLSALDISGNFLGPDISHTLTALPRLAVLDISDNKTGDRGVWALTPLRQLTSLYAGGNCVSFDGARAAASFIDLTDLDLSGNDIGDKGCEALVQLSHLNVLNVSLNRNIGDDGARHLASLKHLTRLDISGNRVGHAGAQALASLRRLVSLDASNNSLGDEGIWALTRLEALNTLALRDNGISSDGAPALALLPNLTSADLRWNSVGEKTMRELAALSKLKELNGVAL